MEHADKLETNRMAAVVGSSAAGRSGFKAERTFKQSGAPDYNFF